MGKFKNNQGINSIELKKSIHNLCTIGKQWYTNNLKVIIDVGEYIPDYIEVDKALYELEGKELIVEDVVAEVVEIFKKYNPIWISVESYVEDAVHLPVKVSKQWNKYDEDKNN